jgi:hypothetical protein
VIDIVIILITDGFRILEGQQQFEKIIGTSMNYSYEEIHGTAAAAAFRRYPLSSLDEVVTVPFHLFYF